MTEVEETAIEKPLERQKHPTYDRETAIFMAVSVFVMLVIAGIGFLSHWLDAKWLKYVAIGMLPVGVCVVMIKARHTNVRACPNCSRLMRRPPDTTEFTCMKCRTIWWTHSFGSSVWD
jgi:hypothetical protein